MLGHKIPTTAWPNPTHNTDNCQSNIQWNTQQSKQNVGAEVHVRQPARRVTPVPFGVQKASNSLSRPMFWEYSPSLTNLASADWLRTKTALLWMRKKEKDKWTTVSILHSVRREQTYLLTCGRRSLVSGTQNDIVVSWITLWRMIKVSWL